LFYEKKTGIYLSVFLPSLKLNFILNLLNASNTFNIRGFMNTQPALKKNVSNNSGSTLIVVLVLAVIVGLLIQSLSYSAHNTIKSSGHHISKVSSLNIAEAGKESFYAKLRSETFLPKANSDSTVFNEVPFADGTYTVTCKTDSNPELLTIRSIGSIRGEKTTIEITARYGPEVAGWKFSKKVPGAITARYTVNLAGNIHVDGNNYDSLLKPTGLSGTFGVWTCMTALLQGDSSKVGGNGNPLVNRVNIPPVRSLVMAEMAPVDSRLSSPEAFFGLEPGALDKFIVPSLTIPFHGVVYVTSTVGPVDLKNSSGILIIHNATKTAEFKGTQGTFKGILICDNVNRINGEMQIAGAVVALSENASSWFGNGQANIFFSSQVLDNLRGYCDNVDLVLSEKSWKEVK
jgi:hypothetical protein